MLVFRCSRCAKVNISIEGHRCQHCGNEETRVSLVSENHTEVRSASVNDNDAFLFIQNKSEGTDFSVYAQASNRCNVAKLHEGDKNEKDSKTLDVNGLEIYSSQGEPVRPTAKNSILKEILILQDATLCSNSTNDNTQSVNALDISSLPGESVRPIAQNSILKEMLILQGPTPCSNSGNANTTSDATISTKKLKLTSGLSSRHKSKNNPEEKKTLKQNKSTKSIIKLNRRSSRPYSPGKSMEDSFNREGINVNRMENNQRKLDSSSLLSKKINPTINNNIKDDLTTTKASSKKISRKGCINTTLNEKLPIKRIKTPILKKVFLCDKCEKTFFDETKLKEHKAYHFRKKRFKCDRCDKGFFSEAHLKKHYKSHMDKGPFKCEFCYLVFDRNCHLSRHRKKHTLEPRVDANGDQEKVDSSQQRTQETRDDDDTQKHLESWAEEKMLQQGEQETRVNHHEHFQTWAEEKMLQQGEQETSDDPEKHFQTWAEEKMLQQGEQETRVNHHEHFQTWAEEKILQQGEQETRDDPHEHFEPSAEENMLQQGEQETCDDDDPQKHFQTSVEQKIFLCNECGAKFIRESDFNAHSLRHSAQKPFKCNECNKEFRYEFELNKHYRVHSLERPFICKICGFSFTQVSNLYKHAKIHA